jgi:hypothetical protein
VFLRVVEHFASTLETVKDPVQNLYKELYKKEYEVLQYDQLLQTATQCENLQIDENHCVAVKEATKNQAKSSDGSITELEE